MAEVFLCQTGQLTQTSKRDLRRAGVVVVEVDDPSTCQFIRSTEIVSGDDMVWAAFEALSHNYGYGNLGEKQRERLAMNLWRIINKAHGSGEMTGKAES